MGTWQNPVLSQKLIRYIPTPAEIAIYLIMVMHFTAYAAGLPTAKRRAFDPGYLREAPIRLLYIPLNYCLITIIKEILFLVIPYFQILRAFPLSHPHHPKWKEVFRIRTLLQVFVKVDKRVFLQSRNVYCKRSLG